MDDIKPSEDFLPLSPDQIQELASVVREELGPDLLRAAFTNHLLTLLEDVPGFETGDVPTSLIESAWAIYSGGRS
ncbi:hypothetical protein [Burkholderia pseudomallei]|uniref:hypothetical protein n=1 Tax=Burkholderia pseudomallei TaxID=28450 RepID=UPI000E6A49CD|nr:hypothetical protein [Burkholderia pseudomallei]RIV56483.1 hypothetical protein D2W70_03090 [Burkholderia pseudomallei]RIV61252.1 hypothetical protein D2W49_15785 [Burkholderia pseudomallei]